MRIVQWSGLPAVVRVRAGKDVTVAVPKGIPRNDVLGLASLILSNSEYQQLWHAMPPPAPAGKVVVSSDGAAGTAASGCRHPDQRS